MILLAILLDECVHVSGAAEGYRHHCVNFLMEKRWRRKLQDSGEAAVRPRVSDQLPANTGMLYIFESTGSIGSGPRNFDCRWT